MNVGEIDMAVYLYRPKNTKQRYWKRELEKYTPSPQRPYLLVLLVTMLNIDKSGTLISTKTRFDYKTENLVYK